MVFKISIEHNKKYLASLYQIIMLDALTDFLLTFQRKMSNYGSIQKQIWPSLRFLKHVLTIQQYI